VCQELEDLALARCETRKRIVARPGSFAFPQKLAKLREKPRTRRIVLEEQVIAAIVRRE
jgi:hypothetical protein